VYWTGYRGLRSGEALPAIREAMPQPAGADGMIRQASPQEWQSTLQFPATKAPVFPTVRCSRPRPASIFTIRN